MTPDTTKGSIFKNHCNSDNKIKVFQTFPMKANTHLYLALRSKH